MKRILLLIAAILVFFTSNAQSDYYKRKADGYLREAEYYQKKAEGYRRETISTKLLDMKMRLHTT